MDRTLGQAGQVGIVGRSHQTFLRLNFARGFMTFGELPDGWTVTGAAFIVASGLYTAHRERVRRSQLPVEAEPSPNA
jgi:drug/metabolite transporter (DMT)-like permease